VLALRTKPPNIISSTVEIIIHLVVAHNGNERAEALLATAYDKLGYQAESAQWRGFT
jgi:alkyl sulfatase BDS1-like metallo-beta-lactamase superfamily hydrolase